MSKNLRGYSGTQIQVNLDDITASSITATNEAFTNLSIGTYNITTLNVSDLVATGVIKFTGLTAQSALNTDDHNILIHDPTTNRIYKFTGLTFSPINNQLTCTNLDVTGTLSVGTLQFTSGNITGNLTVQGTTTCNGNIVLNSVPQATDNTNFLILFRGANNTIQGLSTFVFNPSTGLLKSPFLEVSNDVTINNNLSVVNNVTINNDLNVANDVTINSNLTLTDVFEIKQQANPADRLISIEEAGTSGVCYIKGPLANYGYNIGIWNNDHMRFQCSQFYRFYVDGNEVCQMTNNFLRFTRNFRMENNSQFQLQDDDPTTNGDKGILLWNQEVNQQTFTKIRLTGYQDANGDWELHFEIFGAGDRIKMTSTGVEIYTTTYTDDADLPIFFGEPTTGSLYEISKDDHLTYNPSTNKLISGSLELSGQLTLSPTVGTSSIDFNITFLNTSDQFRVGGTSRPLTFNPSAGILKSYDLELSNDLTVTGRTDLGTIVSINSLNSVVTNTTYPLLTWDNTSSGSRTIRVDIPNLYYDTTDNTLYAPNFSGNLSGDVTSTNATVTNLTASNPISQPIQSIQTDSNYNVLFYDSTNNQITEDAGSQLQYNPNNNTLTVNNVTIDSETVLTNTPEGNANIFFNILFKNSNNQIRIGQTASHPFQFRPSDGTLKCSNVEISDDVSITNDATISNDLIVNGNTNLSDTTINGTVTIDSTSDFTFNNEPKFDGITSGTSNQQEPIVYIDRVTNQLRRSVVPNFSFNPISETLNVKNIVFGTGLNIGYTNTFYRPAINTIDESNLTTVGTFGTGNRLLWNPSGTGGPNVIKEFGLNVGGAWDFEGNTVGTLQLKNLGTVQSPIYHSGTWRIDMEVQYQNTLTGSNDRVTPKLRFMKRPFLGSYTEEVQVTQGSQYFRMSQGKIGTIQCSGVFYASGFDNFRIDTLLNIGTNTSYTDTTTFRFLEEFKLNLTYLSSYGETVL
jgi:hypothetical protein